MLYAFSYFEDAHVDFMDDGWGEIQKIKMLNTTALLTLLFTKPTEAIATYTSG